jgi:hypothetical protein
MNPTLGTSGSAYTTGFDFVSYEPQHSATAPDEPKDAQKTKGDEVANRVVRKKEPSAPPLASHSTAIKVQPQSAKRMKFLGRLHEAAENLKFYSQMNPRVEEISFLGSIQAGNHEGFESQSVPSMPLPVLRLAPDFLAKCNQFVQLRGDAVSRNKALLTNVADLTNALQKTELYPESAEIYTIASDLLGKMAALNNSPSHFGEIQEAPRYLKDAPNGFWLLHLDQEGQSVISIKRGRDVISEYIDLRATDDAFQAKYAPLKQLKANEVNEKMERINASPDTFRGHSQAHSQVQAERYLKNAPDGVFLVRFDEQLQRSVISQKIKDQVIHEEIPFYLSEAEFLSKFFPSKRLFPNETRDFPDLSSVLKPLEDLFDETNNDFREGTNENTEKLTAAFFIHVNEFMQRDEQDKELTDKMSLFAHRLARGSNGLYNETLETIKHVHNCINACRAHPCAHRHISREKAEDLLGNSNQGRLLYFDEAIQQNVICRKKAHGFTHEILNFIQHPIGQPTSDYYQIQALMQKHIENIGTDFLKPFAGTWGDWLSSITG